MMTQEQKWQSLVAPQIPLRFLFSDRQRATSMRQFRADSAPVNESGAFFRLWDLLCTLREPEVQDLLDDPTRELYEQFQKTLDALPWCPLDGVYSHIQQLEQNDLSDLAQPARTLSEQLSRLAWQLMPWRERIRRTIYRLTHRED